MSVGKVAVVAASVAVAVAVAVAEPLQMNCSRLLSQIHVPFVTSSELSHLIYSTLLLFRNYI